MKQIFFGYNKKDYLDSGIEKKTDYIGGYIDIIEIDNRKYLFTKGISKIKKDKIDVREIIQDVYPDGSFVVYANAVRSDICQNLEQIFNEDKIKSAALTGISLISLFDGSKVKINRPNMIPIDNENQFVMVVLIKNQVFEDARQLLIDNSNKSFIELASDKLYVKNHI